MTGRRIRNLLLLALVAGIGWWIYKDRPTASGLIDSITNPLLGSRAAVKTSERNRVVGDASTAIVTTEQADLPINSLKEGMTTMEVRELLGEPQRIDPVPEGGPNRFRWTYTKVGRILTMQDNKIAAIEIIR
jgi:hypothetical protein